jgi:hypothetical protein
MKLIHYILVFGLSTLTLKAQEKKTWADFLEALKRMHSAI